MKIQNSKKFHVVGMTAADYREGIINLMCMLEEHSEEFKTPEQLVMLVHEYSELMTTVYNMDQPDDDEYAEEITEESEDDYDDE